MCVYMFIRPQSQELDIDTVRIFLYVYNIVLVDFRVANDENTSHSFFDGTLKSTFSSDLKHLR